MKTDRTDQRTRITKKMIREAFLALLAEKDIRHITVRELCERAEINRGTFYAHYLDIYDLKEQIENELIDEFDRSVAEIASSGELGSVYLVCRSVFELLRENSELCTILLSWDANDRIIEKFVRVGKDAFIAFYRQIFPHAEMEKLERYYLFISAGCVVSLRKWLLSGMPESVDSLAQSIAHIITDGIGYLSGSAS